MGRKKLPDRVICFEERKSGAKRFRVHFVAGGVRRVRAFVDRADAKRFEALHEKVTRALRTDQVGELFTKYAEDRVTAKKWDPDAFAYRTKISRLRTFFAPVLKKPVGMLNADDIGRCIRQHDTDERPAYNTRADARSKAKAFLRWCVRQGLLPDLPWREAFDVPTERTNPRTIRIDDARRLRAVVDPAALAGDEGAAFVLIGLIMGMRTTEITGIRVDSFDDDGRILRYVDAKSKHEHSIYMPPVVRRVLGTLAEHARAAGRVEVFAPRNKSWGAEVTRQWARAAGLDVAMQETAGGRRRQGLDARWLRRTKDTIAVAAGVSCQVVAAETNHTEAVMRDHYVARGAEVTARARSVDATTAPHVGNEIPDYRTDRRKAS